MKRWVKPASLRADTPSLLVLGKLIAAILALISAPIVARSLGPAGRGQTAATIALYQIVPIVMALGIPLEVRRLAATTSGAQALRASRFICLVSLVPATVVALVLNLALFNDFSRDARIVATLGIALSPLMVSWLCDNSVLVAHGRYRAVLVLHIAQPAIYVLFIVTAWAFGVASVASVLLGHVVGTITTFVVGILLTGISLNGPRQSCIQLLRNATKYAGSMISEVAANRLDQVIALPLLGAFQAGIYSVAVTIAAIPLTLGHALAASYFTPIARSSPGRARIELKSQASRSAIAVGVLSFVPLLIISRVGIPLIFGEEFTLAVPVTAVCLIGSVAMVASFVYSMVLTAEARGVFMTFAQLGALLTGICLLFLLGPMFGAMGAAIASTVTYFVLLGALYFGLNISLQESVPTGPDFAIALRRLTASAEKRPDEDL